MNNKSLLMTTFFVLSIIGAYTIYKPFLLSMTVAILLVMATYNLTKKLIQKFKSRKTSAIISSIFLMLILFAPIIYMATIGVGYISKFDISTVNDITAVVKKFINGLPYVKDWHDVGVSDEQIKDFIQEYTSYIRFAVPAGIGFLKNMLLVLIFYFLISFYGEKFFELIRALIPISKTKSAKMIHEISSTMEVVFYSVIVTAILEGFVFGIMVGYFGFNGLFFGMIYGFASLIPIVGGVIVWLPVSLYAWAKIDANTALFIGGYSILVISVFVDTFVKTAIIKIIKDKLLKSTIEINEIVIFFSILAGMTSYGFWGMILGPAITAFLIAITKVYIDYNNKELL